METKATIKDFIDQLKVDYTWGLSKVYVTHDDLKELANDFVDVLVDGKEFTIEDLDLNNDNGTCNEWADGMVDIYNQDLYENAWAFSEYTEDALEEYGYDEKRGLIGVLMVGQYKFYEEFSMMICHKLEEFLTA